VSIFGMAHVYGQMARAGQKAGRASSEATRARIDVRELADRIDKLALVCNAMWTLIQDKTDLTEQDLFDRVEQLDLRDGVLDGKVTKTVRVCANCGRKMSARHNKCLYCGAPKASESAFDEV